MRTSHTIAIVSAAILVAGLALRVVFAPEEGVGKRPETAGPPVRIVSMAPSLTETLFALGVGERIAGVTRYCNYPVSAQAKPKVGGFLDPNYERILGIEADLVVLLPYHTDAASRLEQLGIPTLTVDHETVPQVLDSFETLAQVCGVPEAGAVLRGKVAAELDEVRERVAGLESPSVLLSVGRTLVSGRIDQVYVSGPNGWHGQLVEIAGGRNVLGETRLAYPMLSAEAILQLNPDVIIEIADPESDDPQLAETLAASWRTLETVEAVRTDRVYIIHKNYAGVPGPRIGKLARDFADALHPETGVP